MIDNHHIQYRTQGDLAREQLRRRGIPYFADVQVEIKQRLAQMKPVERKAFALACAERLMQLHDPSAPTEQVAFVGSLRPVLRQMWAGIIHEDVDTARYVADVVNTFHTTGPEAADQDVTAASIYAAECFLTGSIETAYWASARAVDAAFKVAVNELQLDPNDYLRHPDAEPPMPLAQEAMHAAVQNELRKQLSDLDEIQYSGVNPDLLMRLRR